MKKIFAVTGIIAVVFAAVFMFAKNVQLNKKYDLELKNLVAQNIDLEKQVNGYLEADKQREAEEKERTEAINESESKAREYSEAIARLKAQIAQIRRESPQNGNVENVTIIQENKLLVSLTIAQEGKINELEVALDLNLKNYESCKKSRGELRLSVEKLREIISNNDKICAIQKKKRFRRGVVVGIVGTGIFAVVLYFLLK